MMATMRTKREKANGHSYEYADLQPVEWRADGTPCRYELVSPDEPSYAPAPYEDAPIVAPTQPDRLPRVQRVVTGSHIDEARAFNIRVSSLAAVLGGGVVFAGLIFGASLSFWSALMWFGTTFAIVWAAAFTLDAFTSAGGVELFHAMRMWAFLDREQAHRHNRYNAPPSDRVRLIQTIVGAAAIGATALFFLLILAAVFAENMPR